MKVNMEKIIENGMAILNDFDKNTYVSSPAPKVKVAVLVPDWNIPQMTAMEMRIKKYLFFFIFDVMPNMMKATAAPAA